MHDKQRWIAGAALLLIAAALVLFINGYSIMQGEYFLMVTETSEGNQLGIFQVEMTAPAVLCTVDNPVADAWLVDNKRICLSLQGNEEPVMATVDLTNATVTLTGKQASDPPLWQASFGDNGAGMLSIPGTTYQLKIDNGILCISDAETGAVFDTGARGDAFTIALSNPRDRLAIVPQSTEKPELYIYNLKDMYLINSITLPGNPIHLGWCHGNRGLVGTILQNGLYQVVRIPSESENTLEIICSSAQPVKVFALDT